MELRAIDRRISPVGEASRRAEIYYVSRSNGSRPSSTCGPVHRQPVAGKKSCTGIAQIEIQESTREADRAGRLRAELQVVDVAEYAGRTVSVLDDAHRLHAGRQRHRRAEVSPGLPSAGVRN